MKSYKLIMGLLFLSVIFQKAHSQEVSASSDKLFSFGVVADIQYADAEQKGNRAYRQSLDKLEQCVSKYNLQNLSFVITLGDMIDRDYASFDKPLALLGRLKDPVYNVIGNHDFSVADALKGNVKERLNNGKGYFDFKKSNFTIIILDGTDVSTLAYPQESVRYNAGRAKYEVLKERGAHNATMWNGGIGDKQLRWLEKRLQNADQTNQNVILFCHWPLLPENGTQLWNNKEVLALLQQHPSIVAWIAGHHHEGSYRKKEKNHYLTLKGMVEAKAERSCGYIDVYSNKLVLRGYGDQTDRVMKIYR